MTRCFYPCKPGTRYVTRPNIYPGTSNTMRRRIMPIVFGVWCLLFDRRIINNIFLSWFRRLYLLSQVFFSTTCRATSRGEYRIHDNDQMEGHESVIFLYCLSRHLQGRVQDTRQRPDGGARQTANVLLYVRDIYNTSMSFPQYVFSTRRCFLWSWLDFRREYFLHSFCSVSPYIPSFLFLFFVIFVFLSQLLFSCINSSIQCSPWSQDRLQ